MAIVLFALIRAAIKVAVKVVKMLHIGSVLVCTAYFMYTGRTRKLSTIRISERRTK